VKRVPCHHLDRIFIMNRIIAAILVASACVGCAHAQAQAEAPARWLSLADALDLATGKAPATDAAQAGVEAARAGRTTAGLRPNPTVQTQVENVAGSNSYGGFRQAETTLMLNLPIELGGKRSARIAQADARTDRALIEAAVQQAELRYQVTQLYVDAVAALRRAAVARDQLRIAREALGAAQVRVRSGRASPLEEQRADVARINAQAGVEQAERLARAAWDNLARRIGRSVNGALDEGMIDAMPAAVTGPALPMATEGTLAMAAARADVAISTAGVQIARSQRVPDLAVGPGLRRLSASNDTALVFSVSVPLPLFNGGRAAVAQAAAEQSRAEALQRLTEQEVAQAITSAQAEADNAATAARAASGPALEAAQEAARIARIGYREGKFGQLDLLDAERTLAQTRVAAIDALAAYHIARARLERLTARAPE